MNEINYDEAFEQVLIEIYEEKQKLNENEQNFVDVWVSKLREIEDDEGKPLRQDYANYLRAQLEKDPKRLSFPFTNMPPESILPPIHDLLSQTAGSPSRAVPERSRYFCPAGDKNPPYRPKTDSAKRRDRQPKECRQNEFENLEEMAKSIARSKGVMLAEFVADVSCHTADKGHELRMGMKSETASFRECVERIVNQRVKDVGDLLNYQQADELLKIQKDYDKWQAELSICKKRLKEIVPEFNIDAYKGDKNYFKKIFCVDPSNPPGEDKFKEWKEENCHRLMWFVNEIDKLTVENNQVLEEISSIKAKALELERNESEKHRCHAEHIESETNKIKQLKHKCDKLAREIADLLVSQEN